MTAAPFRAAAPAAVRPLPLLLAPRDQLSGDGQLRELIAERRDRRGDDAELWYVPSTLLEELDLAAAGQEAVVATDPGVITWLQLRFGGRSALAELSPTLLQERAGALPPVAPAVPLDR